MQIKKIDEFVVEVTTTQDIVEKVDIRELISRRQILADAIAVFDDNAAKQKQAWIDKLGKMDEQIKEINNIGVVATQLNGKNIN